MLDSSRAQWAQLHNAVRQSLKDLKAEEANNTSLEKKMKKRESRKREGDAKTQAEEAESSKKARVQSLLSSFQHLEAGGAVAIPEADAELKVPEQQCCLSLEEKKRCKGCFHVNLLTSK